MALAISICATKAYTYAMHLQARRVQQCVTLAKVASGHVILSGDDSPELKAVADLYRDILPEGWQVHHRASVPADPALERPHKDRDDDGNQARKARAFRRIGDMRDAAHALALKLGVSHCWSLDSDVLPPVNALRASFDALAWDGGYYSVAFCPYPNMLWLGGLGEPGRPMAEDFLPHERKLSRRHRLCLEACERRMKAAPSDREARRKARLEKRARTKPADGNIWQVIAKYGWRRRGWLDHAYPGIGLGVMVPSTWCGFGCTLMSREALTLADFSGYAGQGTEDVFVIAHRWQPAELRIALLPHCPCDHLHMERRGGEDHINYLRAYHEPAGECRGHLRIESRPWPAGLTPAART